MITRRSLFGLLSAAFALDPERLLWTPGKTLISIPNRNVLLSSDLITREALLSLARHLDATRSLSREYAHDLQQLPKMGDAWHVRRPRRFGAILYF